MPLSTALNPVTGYPTGPQTTIGGIGGLFTDIGNGLKYAAEQCTAFVADIFSWVPSGWGAAGNWLTAAKAQGYATSATPVPGAIAVWAPNSGGAGAEGHVAAVTAVDPTTGLPTVEEANFTYKTVSGVGRFDTRVVTRQSAAGIIGYILPPSGTPMATVPNTTTPSSGLDLNPFDVLPHILDAITGIPGAIAGALGTALGAALSALGHAIAHVIGVTFTDLGVFAEKHVVPLAVAGAVTATLFA